MVICLKMRALVICLLLGSFVGMGAVVQADESTAPKIRVLVVDGFSNHDWKQTTAWVKGFLEKTGRFQVDVSTAPASKDSNGWDQWRPSFADYDVVVQNCNSHGGRPSWPKEVQTALEKYVRDGGGLYILHSANNAFPEWKEYNQMIGLGWRKKDFGVAITIDDKGGEVRVPAGQGGGTSHGKRMDATIMRIGEHPLHKGFPKQWKAADLEVYSYARGPAENLTVLSYAREPKTGLNFPIEWVVKYGKGRVYNSTFGHVWANASNPPAIRCAGFQTLLLRVTEWLATGKVTTPVPEDFPTAEKVSLRD
ncbi:ThuA domain-containing protein [Verrucomicrobiaceae bacterium N1E253]|uniref:ThuA domain-containing protein n=1 Tax=Oceaniferula marina TaxID=2748318 RepID=A0A851GL60_9BACT|nr:ThuA domain-containing protein [Oceaniferula marina]NWK54894.1 ThuA domain-containing protein [Oceaniferula marina]